MREPAIDGPSAGLAFFLLLASRLLGVAPCSDVVASATLDAWGGVGPVEGLEIKIPVLRNLAPRVRRLVVAANQIEVARSLCDGDLEVIGVRSAAEALDQLLGAGLSRRLIQDAGSSPLTRDAWIRSLFRLVLRGRREWLDWNPVEHAAQQALQDWTQLTGDEEYTLKLGAAVAARHSGNRGVLPTPSAEWLARLSAPVRLQVLAHLVQQCADTGEPGVAEVRRLVEKDLARDLSEGFRPQLQLAGALARLDAVTGRVEEALRVQSLLARAHLDNLDHEEVSQPLCEWLRLSAALGNSVAFEEARTFLREAEGAAALSSDDRGYVSLAVARGRLQLRIDDSGEGQRELLSLAISGKVADHVRRSAARWHLEGTRRLAGAEAIDAARERLAEACPASDEDGNAYVILGELDEALTNGDRVLAASALERLARAQPGPTRHLMAAATPGEEAAYVARFFPY